MNPAALYDALKCASLSVLAAEGGRAREAEETYLEAAVAAAEAFPPGEDADALNRILGTVRAVAKGPA